MSSVKDLKDKLASTRPTRWEQFPDIELYKDQVLTYMQRQMLPSESSENLTGAMINNYIKAGALQRPNGKKYSKEHLAHLTAICALKPVLSVNDIEYLLRKHNNSSRAEEFYGFLYEQIDKALTDIALSVDDELCEANFTEYIFSVALHAVGLKIVCEKLLQLMREKDNKESTEKKSQNENKKNKKENKSDKK